jgi:hypothetical protein
LDDGRDSGLPGISDRLLEPTTPQQSVGVNREQNSQPSPGGRT